MLARDIATSLYYSWPREFLEAGENARGEHELRLPDPTQKTGTRPEGLDMSFSPAFPYLAHSTSLNRNHAFTPAQISLEQLLAQHVRQPNSS